MVARASVSHSRRVESRLRGDSLLGVVGSLEVGRLDTCNGARAMWGL